MSSIDIRSMECFNNTPPIVSRMVRNEEALRRFGNRLTAVREQKKISIAELAAAAALESELVSAIEAGQVNLLLTTILALAKGLGVSAHELLQFF